MIWLNSYDLGNLGSVVGFRSQFHIYLLTKLSQRSCAITKNNKNKQEYKSVWWRAPRALVCAWWAAAGVFHPARVRYTRGRRSLHPIGIVLWKACVFVIVVDVVVEVVICCFCRRRRMVGAGYCMVGAGAPRRALGAKKEARPLQRTWASLHLLSHEAC